MHSVSILFPAIVLLWWTLVILLIIPYRRHNPAVNDGVTFEDFKKGESGKISDYVAMPNRNYMNLLEAPVLFYVSIVFIFITQTVSDSMIFLAWLYAVIRIAHSLVHITYNKVLHRFALFGASNFVLSLLVLLMTISIARL